MPLLPACTHFDFAGLLAAISDFRIISPNIIVWNSPFSLNLTNIEPDVLYCVDIFNITCDLIKYLESDCDVNATEYTLDLPEPVGYIFRLAITPRTNSKDAQNGSVFSVEGIS